MFKTQWIICGIETHELEVSSQKCKLSIWKFATSLSRFNEAIISIWRLFGEAIKDIKEKEEKRITDILNYLTSLQYEDPLRLSVEDKARDKLKAYEADLNARYEA